MKTAEQHFEERNGGKSPSSELITELYAIDLMKSFSDQQNKELREENKELKASLNTFSASVDFAQAEIVKLKRLLKEIEQALADGHYDINDSWLPSKLCRKITKAIVDGLQLDPHTEGEIQRLTKELELCQTWNINFQMEVEGLKYLQQEDKDTITRLRELLGESKDLLLVASTGYPQIEFLERVKKLLTEIDNALNHKL